MTPVQPSCPVARPPGLPASCGAEVSARSRACALRRLKLSRRALARRSSRGLFCAAPVFSSIGPRKPKSGQDARARPPAPACPNIEKGDSYVVYAAHCGRRSARRLGCHRGSRPDPRDRKKAASARTAGGVIDVQPLWAFELCRAPLCPRLRSAGNLVGERLLRRLRQQDRDKPRNKPKAAGPNRPYLSQQPLWRTLCAAY
jgi:hypothetical protein